MAIRSSMTFKSETGWLGSTSCTAARIAPAKDAASPLVRAIRKVAGEGFLDKGEEKTPLPGASPPSRDAFSPPTREGGKIGRESRGGREESSVGAASVKKKK